MTAPHHTAEDAALLAWVRERDAACPLCRYNLRALTEPRCPECRHRLVLAVGTPDVRIGWLVAAIAPGIFSGISACFFLVIIIASTWNASPPPWFIHATDAFGFASGAAAIALVARRRRFLAWRAKSQALAALLVWVVHIGVFVLLVSGVLV